MGAELAPLVEFTPEGLLGLLIAMIMLGYLIPLRIVRGRLADKDAIIAEQRAVIADLRRNNDQLLRGNSATVQVLDATAEAVGGVSPDRVGGSTDAEVV